MGFYFILFYYCSNPEMSCDEIVDIDYFAWQDSTCENAPTRTDAPNIMTSTKIRTPQSIELDTVFAV